MFDVNDEYLSPAIAAAERQRKAIAMELEREQAEKRRRWPILVALAVPALSWGLVLLWVFILWLNNFWLDA